MNAVEDIIGIIYGLHSERIRLKKVFAALPPEIQKKHQSTVTEVDEYIDQHGHSLAEIVLDMM